MNESIQEIILNNNSNLTTVANITNYTSSFIDNSSIYFLNISNTTPIISKIDPNWFYSASAQSAAAIVGLMGAFITTKLINHKSFVTQIQKEITECQNKIDYINREIKPKSQYINDLDYETDSKLVDDFLDYIKNTIDPNNPYSLDELYGKTQEYSESMKYRDISKNVLEEKFNSDYLDKIRVNAEDLVDKFLEEEASEIDLENLPNLNDFYERAKEKDGYKYIQMSVLKEKYNVEYLSKIKNKIEATTGFYLWQKNMLSLGNTPFVMSNLTDSAVNKRKWEKYWRYKEEVTEKKAELSYYEYLLQDKKSTLESKTDILSLKSNIYTLLLFSITGIFLPLFMMLCDYDVMIKYRSTTFVFIFVGWMFVVVNLGTDIWNLFNSTKY